MAPALRIKVELGEIFFDLIVLSFPLSKKKILGKTVKTT